MNKVSTKDRILDAALDLFAEKGFDGVGVDLIAAGAGLKGPSIYKHFKGKDDILVELIRRGEEYYEMNFGSERKPGKLPANMEEMIQLSLGRIRFTMNDPTIRKMRKLFTMEQFRSERIAKLATLHNIEGICSMYTKILGGMMQAGMIRKEDPRTLALNFSAPTTLMIQMVDREPEREAEAMEIIEAQLRLFARTYGISPEEK